MVYYEVPQSEQNRLPQSPPPLPPRTDIENPFIPQPIPPEYYEYDSISSAILPRKQSSGSKCCKSLWCCLSTTFSLAFFAMCLIGSLRNECSVGYTYFDGTGYCYKVVLELVTFDKAKASCESERAHLASIHSKAENDFLRKFYYEKTVESIAETHKYIESSRLWIGLVYLNEKWQWTDGTKGDYWNWAVNEPNKLELQEYWTEMVTYEQDWAPTGSEWNNARSDWKRAHFCKKPSLKMETFTPFVTIKTPELVPVTVSLETTTTAKPVTTPSKQWESSNCINGYTYFEGTGFCYKIQFSEFSFDNAERSCEQDKAHLVSIHSEQENNFLKEFYRKQLREHQDHVNEHQEKSSLWIGLVYLNGEWQWLDGTEKNFTKYAENEPNNIDVHEYWTEMVTRSVTNWTPNGNEWNNIMADDKTGRASICKRPPKSARTTAFRIIEGPTLPPKTTTTPISTTTISSTISS